MNPSPETNELFELCKEVYKRTGWGDIEWHNDIHNTKKGYWWHVNENTGDYVAVHEAEGRRYDNLNIEICPLYTSDYILEKLARNRVSVKKDNIGNTWTCLGDGTRSMDDVIEVSGDTPLKALLKLVIALDDAKELS